jgi:hypothetical protein
LHVATTGNATPYLHFTTDGTGHTASDGASVYLDRSTDGLNLSAYETNGTIVFRTNGAVERMRIDSSGNVGIGNTGNSSRKLDITQDSGQSAGVRVRSDGSGAYYQMFTGTANPKIGSSHNTDQIELHTGGSERMRIASGGTVQISGPSGASTITTDGTQFIPASDKVEYRWYCGTTISRTAVSFRNPNGQVGYISVSGTSTNFNTSSDHRLKENVVYDFDATTRLKQLRPARFNFIADADTTVDGFLAHEVQSIVPEAISGTHNEVDDDGNPVYQGIDQSKLVPLLVKTIQELEARIVALETA